MSFGICQHRRAFLRTERGCCTTSQFRSSARAAPARWPPAGVYLNVAVDEGVGTRQGSRRKPLAARLAAITPTGPDSEVYRSSGPCRPTPESRTCCRCFGIAEVRRPAFLCSVDTSTKCWRQRTAAFAECICQPSAGFASRLFSRPPAWKRFFDATN